MWPHQKNNTRSHKTIFVYLCLLNDASVILWISLSIRTLLEVRDHRETLSGPSRRIHDTLRSTLKLWTHRRLQSHRIAMHITMITIFLFKAPYLDWNSYYGKFHHTVVSSKILLGTLIPSGFVVSLDNILGSASTKLPRPCTCNTRSVSVKIATCNYSDTVALP